MSKDEDPPISLVDPNKLFIALIVFVAVLIVSFVWCANHFAKAGLVEEVSLSRCFLKADLPHCIIKGDPRAMLVDIDKIIPCESNGDPLACNEEFGCNAGMGLCGFIKSTWNETLDKMSCSGIYDTEKCFKFYMPERCWEKVSLPVSKEKTEMIFDGECNRLAGKWLLENEGSQHWGTSETKWGSWSCWSK